MSADATGVWESQIKSLCTTPKEMAAQMRKKRICYHTWKGVRQATTGKEAEEGQKKLLKTETDVALDQTPRTSRINPPKFASACCHSLLAHNLKSCLRGPAQHETNSELSDTD